MGVEVGAGVRFRVRVGVRVRVRLGVGGRGRGRRDGRLQLRKAADDLQAEGAHLPLVLAQDGQDRAPARERRLVGHERAEHGGAVRAREDGGLLRDGVGARLRVRVGSWGSGLQ